MERTKEPLSRERRWSQHALQGARLEIYGTSLAEERDNRRKTGRGQTATRKKSFDPLRRFRGRGTSLVIAFLAALRARADAQGFCEATGSLWTTNKMSVWGQEYERWTPVDERLIHRLECSCNATWN